MDKVNARKKLKTNTLLPCYHTLTLVGKVPTLDLGLTSIAG